MSNTLITKNNQLLLTQNGAVKKQNYQFGNGFNTGNINGGVNLNSPDDLGIGSPNQIFSCFGFAQAQDSNVCGVLQLLQSGAGHFDFLTSSNSSFLYNREHDGGINIGQYSPKRVFFGFGFDGVNYYSRSGRAVAGSTPAYFLSSIQFDAISLGSAYSSGLGQIVPTNTIPFLIFFDRIVADREWIPMYNNLSGGDPLSLVGCRSFLKLQKAEAFDFSAGQDGSDIRVGVRDYSGLNKHWYFTGLPAGTIEDKLTYANTNYFTPFV